MQTHDAHIFMALICTVFHKTVDQVIQKIERGRFFMKHGVYIHIYIYAMTKLKIMTLYGF